MSRARRLPRSFFLGRGTEEVARALIGCCLAHETHQGLAVGRIVEAEAYLSEEDAASHSRNGATDRNRAMFGPPGTAYVYLIYGVHHCLNVVTAPEGIGEAVLLRALHPLEGLEVMARRRGVEAHAALCSGPGKLVQALGVGREHDGVDLCRGDLGLWTPESFGEGARAESSPITTGPRIGVGKAVALPLRFCLEDSPWLSR